MELAHYQGLVLRFCCPKWQDYQAMSRTFKINQINSNLIFFFPIITSYLDGDAIYCFLSIIMIICASTFYHFFREKKHSNFFIKFLRYADVCIASMSYLYMFYFVHSSNGNSKFFLYFLLALSIFTYILGEKRFAEKYNIHSYFHLFIGIIAGIIPIFA
ncbi:hypothetical protein A3A95_03740 [Candidatus Nomurabacteria bacterium RIFCSPLOWO2_01_FULL_39_18]|uniref:Uncharacterized protein n=1 Tax=Candidatus Nomurabacteria bacterium RIFCSPHIGHO2_01_FULL_40_24b TaxID=1801739 RepID=A0A1F6V6T8_9BACT|nr:MAG: hypothetical protein A2647_04780 [Candidatus Nomurabacteria bacterium RIFCSPHIGHO2_01_FULL_40_24b]OGI89219.1 MAG: hypothetical protein A3A95_03740 [Candidatus Nomurabacteria bacterium RIFCSPLOWO2_01_FULL_39_18]